MPEMFQRKSKGIIIKWYGCLKAIIMMKKHFNKSLFKPITRLLLLTLIFTITFAGGGGSNGGSGKGGGGGGGNGKGGSGGGKGQGCNFESKKPLRVHLGNFQYLPITILTAPQYTCGQNGPDFSATPHRIQASLTPYLPSLLTNLQTDSNYLCEISVVSTCGNGDQIDYPWNSGQNYLDIQIYQDMPCIIHLRYWDRMNMFPCPGSTLNLMARGVWTAQYDNAGAIINDAEITLTPQLAAFSQ
jgi:hypothetical protein